MTTELVYGKKNTDLTREELMDKISRQMSEKRFQHVLRVEKKALELAEKYHVDKEEASIAALTHDYAKERSDDEMIDLIKSHDFSNDLLDYGNAIWHGVLGAYLVEKELDITNPEILDAIRLHTTGAKEMTELAKVIYVADYIEDGRDFPGVIEARECANRDLDEAVAYETYHTLNYLLKSKKKIYPKTLETYNYWVVSN
ncbi:bis(5'-nucleosyl)-tetraphosphatase (symmetrical) YqeK [Vagococcus bubulae]|uniref:bis(5'-nucleosyl)-tetraphosphatase (symmetrical) n=1 Tax=Vagococcus bubulae TaxID=1977868 RepID=A0A429ZBV8_9ENTE|nr:bis(5'-nucleosyl)-tetraphosphatase (symmetrical) YqeK [Vagococcus bubulae]RST91180.1 HD domain-containing protein [Vagococcus bubulae]